MKNVLIIVGVIILLPLVAVGSYILEEIYYNKMGFKAEKAADKYLEKKYGESFEVDDAVYSKALGDDHGGYDVKAHPTANPEISFRVQVTEKYKVWQDEYKESKWASEINKEYFQLAKPLFPNAARIYASGSFPEEVGDQYNITDTYQTIYKENPNQGHEYINIVLFEDSIQKEAALDSVYQLWSVIQGRQLKTYRYEVKYYPEKLLKKFKSYADQHAFEQDFYKDSLYSCRISKFDAEQNPISGPDGISRFCR